MAIFSVNLRTQVRRDVLNGAYDASFERRFGLKQETDEMTEDKIVSVNAGSKDASYVMDLKMINKMSKHICVVRIVTESGVTRLLIVDAKNVVTLKGEFVRV